MRSSPTAKRLTSFVTLTLFLMTLVFVFSPSATAQVVTGTLKGKVVDPNGAVIAGATVTAKNEATGVEKTTATSGDGLFVIPDLLPGKYTVTVAGTGGFAGKAVTGVDVKLGQDTDIKIDLAVGSPTAIVTVTASTEEIVQSTTAQISSSFEARKVQDLPSNAAGAGIDTLALLAPGVVPGFGNVNSNGITLSVNGNRARSNNFTIDGTDNNDLSIGGPNYFVDNQDVVQEFQLITNNFSAQYGRNQGAIVNIVTKSGTNDFHGTAFEFLRNSRLDALTNLERRDPNRGGRRDKFISNVVGGTVGGPIKKNKAFFFGSFQEIIQRQGATVSSGTLAVLPSEFAKLQAAFPGNAAINALINQGAFSLTSGGVRVQPRGDRAPDTICLPKNPSLAFQCTDPTKAASFANGLPVAVAFPLFTFALPINEPEFSVRGDVNATKKDSFYVRYLWQRSPQKNALFSNGFLGDIPFSSKNLSGTYTRQISSRTTNEFRGSQQQLFVKFGGGCTDTLSGCILDPATGIDKTFTNITYFIRGLASAASLRAIGPATNLPQGRIVKVLQFQDNLTLTRGRHTFTTGADIRHLTNSVPFLPNINGAFAFTAARLAANAPLRVTLAAGQSTLDYTENDRFFYLQDDWKARDNLTLNLGVRYEFTGQPINLLSKISCAREADLSTALWRQSLPLEARCNPKIPSGKKNWAPRVGFAWTPRFGEGKLAKVLFGGNDATVIRGGYSIAYDPAFFNILLNVSTSAPMVFLNTITNGGGLATPDFRLPANPTGDVVRSALGGFLQKNTFDPKFLGQTIVAPDFHLPYAQQWSLGIQRQINRNNVAEIRYVGNHGVGLFQTVNRNPQFDNLVNGFTSKGFGRTSFTFPGFPQFALGNTPLTSAQCPKPPTGVVGDNTAVCQGRLLQRGLLRSRENSASSTYNSLQARANGRLRTQLIYGVSYTFSKALDNASEIFSFGENAIAANPFNIGRAERSFSGFDRRHAFSSNVIWDLPFFKGQHGFTGKAIGGWQINSTWVVASGRRFTPSQVFNVFGAPSYQDAAFQAGFIGFDALRPFQGNPNAPATAVGITDVDASYFAGLLPGAGAFVASPTGFYSLNQLNTTGALVPVTMNDVRYILNGPGAARLFGNPFGNVARNTGKGPALNQVNLGVFKNTKISEKLTVQFRAEFFNVFNHPNPGYGVAVGDSLPDFFVEDAGTTFNNFQEMNLSSRRVQFAIRIIF